MRVLHIINSLESGGAEMMLAKLLRALPPPRHEHTVVVSRSGGLVERQVASTGKLISLNAAGSLSAAMKVFKLQEIINYNDPDVIQGWMYHGNLAAALAHGGRPFVFNIRAGPGALAQYKMTTQFVILAGGALAQGARAVVYNSHLARPAHEKWGYPRSKGLVIPNGFDTDELKPDPVARHRIRDELGLDASQRVVCRVARDDPLKDTPTLIEAFSGVVPGTTLLLVGRGMDAANSELSEHLEARGLGRQVMLLGEQHDVPSIIAACDLLVSSSYSEAFPNVVGEAMACAVPVVTTDAGDCSLIVNDATRVVPTRQPDLLAQAINRVLLMQDAERFALGCRDRNRICEEFSLPRVAQAFARLWEEACS